jgi:hypothetical protein
MGQGVVDATAAAGNLGRGEFKAATKNTLKSMSNMAAGGGRLMSTGITAAQTVTQFIPGVGQVASGALAVVGAGANIAANNKTLIKGVTSSVKNYYQGSKQILQGETKEGFKKIGVSALQGAGVAALTGASVMGGGFGKLGGQYVGSVIGKGVSKLSQQVGAKVAKAVATGTTASTLVAKKGSKAFLLGQTFTTGLTPSPSGRIGGAIGGVISHGAVMAGGQKMTKLQQPSQQPGGVQPQMIQSQVPQQVLVPAPSGFESVSPVMATGAVTSQ